MYTDNAVCPVGHHFKKRRREESAGQCVRTHCPECNEEYFIVAGPVPLRALAAGKTRGPNRECQIEQRLVKRVKALGGEVRKVSWVGRKGAPDRLVMLPEQPRGETEMEAFADALGLTLQPWQREILRGKAQPPRTIWVELKAPGKAATFPSNPHERAQRREHERMRKMGQRVEVVDSYERIEELLK